MGNQMIRNASSKRILASADCRIITQFATSATLTPYHLKEFARTSSMPPNVRDVTVQVSRFRFHNIIAPKIV